LGSIIFRVFYQGLRELATGEKRKVIRFLLFLSGRTTLQQARIHGELVAGWVNQRGAEADTVAGRALLAAAGSDPRVTGRAGDLKRRVAVPFLATC
jgi:hypothetical protein